MTDPQLIARHQVNDSLWNKLIDTSLHPVAYAHTWYLDCVSPGWQALVFPSEHGYRAVVPLPVMKKWGFKVIYQPYFCQFLGIYSRQLLTEKDVNALFRVLHHSFPYISQYAFHPDDSPLLAQYLKKDTDVSYDVSSTYWLNTQKPYKSIEMNYSADRRNNLRKARRYPWELVESWNVEPLINLFRQNHEKQIQGGVAESTYTLLRSLVRQASHHQSLNIYYASLQGVVCAGIMVVESNEMGIYLFNAANETGRKGNARTWLLDRYFQEKAGDLRYFDFESPDIEGISNFYRSFGAQEKRFFTIQKNKLPFPLRQLQEWRKRLLKAI